MTAPYDQDAAGFEIDGWLPRRDWGAYVVLATTLIAIGSVEGVLIYHLIQLMLTIGGAK